MQILLHILISKINLPHQLNLREEISCSVITKSIIKLLKKLIFAPFRVGANKNQCTNPMPAEALEARVIQFRLLRNDKRVLALLSFFLRYFVIL